MINLVPALFYRRLLFHFKKIIFNPVPFLIISFFAGCHSAPESKAHPLLPFDNKLYILYLNNSSSKNYLKKILTGLKDPSGKTIYPDKIIFQFLYLQPEGKLTVLAFPGAKDGQGRSDYQNNTDPVILTPSTAFPNTAYDMTGKLVALSDEEINLDKQGNYEPIKILKDLINNQTSDNAFIYFTPVLESFTGSIYKIHYELGVSDKVPSYKHPFTTTPLHISINPSPPRNSY